jgi:hypothetical protein
LSIGMTAEQYWKAGRHHPHWLIFEVVLEMIDKNRVPDDFNIEIIRRGSRVVCVGVFRGFYLRHCLDHPHEECKLGISSLSSLASEKSFADSRNAPVFTGALREGRTCIG